MNRLLRNKLLDSISSNKALAIIDADTRQVLDVFKTSEVGTMIKSVGNYK